MGTLLHNPVPSARAGGRAIEKSGLDQLLRCGVTIFGRPTSVPFNSFGFTLWSLGAGAPIVMGAGVAFWGLGFADINSMQQARLVSAFPALGAAAIVLNASAIYVGQAIGSALGGFLYANGLLRALGYAAMLFVGLSLALLATTRDTNVPA
jgi:predicted MFS family arabinose efflux permease